MSERISVMEHAQQIMHALKNGILLNTNGDKFNSMVISWGHLGYIWGAETFAVYVREGRYTKPQLDKTGEFTLSLPLIQPDPEINRICGLRSGRDIDKVREAHLTLAEPQSNHTPAVLEYPMTLECSILYAQKQDLSFLPGDILQQSYPQHVDSAAPLANRDAHTVYIGRITAAYIL